MKSRLEQVRGLGRALAGSNYVEASSPVEIAKAMSTLSLTPETCLGIVGGDGTVQAALTALHVRQSEGAWPTLFVAPGGSTNMTAKDLGAAGSVIQALQRFNQWSQGMGPAGKTVPRSVVSIHREGEDPVCGMFFGLGLISQGVGFFRDNLRGHAYAGERTSLLSVGRVMLSMGLGNRQRGSEVQAMAWTIDGGPPHRHECTLCLATSLDRLLLGSRPYWGGGTGPLHFTLVEAGAAGIWRNLPRFARGRPGHRLTEDRGYFSQNASVIELTFEGPFVVDGELFHQGASDGPCRLTAPNTPSWLVL